jgi:nucleotide-binding universal stress UspA family protein
MSALQKILVPVDFSEESANDLKYAVSLAQETEAELVVLYVTKKEDANNFYDLLAVVEGAPMLNRPARIPLDRLLSEKALDLYHFIEKVVRDPERRMIRRKVVLGNKAETILRVIEEENIDLVVLTIRNKSIFPYLMNRGKLLKIISRFPCPVVLNPPFRAPWPQLA